MAKKVLPFDKRKIPVSELTNDDFVQALKFLETGVLPETFLVPSIVPVIKQPHTTFILNNEVEFKKSGFTVKDRFIDRDRDGNRALYSLLFTASKTTAVSCPFSSALDVTTIMEKIVGSCASWIQICKAFSQKFGIPMIVVEISHPTNISLNTHIIAYHTIPSLSIIVIGVVDQGYFCHLEVGSNAELPPIKTPVWAPFKKDLFCPAVLTMVIQRKTFALCFQGQSVCSMITQLEVSKLFHITQIKPGTMLQYTPKKAVQHVILIDLSDLLLDGSTIICAKTKTSPSEVLKASDIAVPFSNLVTSKEISPCLPAEVADWLTNFEAQFPVDVSSIRSILTTWTEWKLVTPNGVNDIIHSRELQRLYPYIANDSVQKYWISSDVLNALGLLLPSYSAVVFNTFFFSSVHMMTNATLVIDRNRREIRSQKDFYRRQRRVIPNILLFPVHTGNHWILVIVDCEESKLSVVCSLKQKYPEVEAAFVSFVPLLVEELDLAPIPTDFRVEHIAVSKQDNSFDCGLHVWFYAGVVCNEPTIWKQKLVQPCIPSSSELRFRAFATLSKALVLHAQMDAQTDCNSGNVSDNVYALDNVRPKSKKSTKKTQDQKGLMDIKAEIHKVAIESDNTNALKESLSHGNVPHKNTFVRSKSVTEAAGVLVSISQQLPVAAEGTSLLPPDVTRYPKYWCDDMSMLELVLRSNTDEAEVLMNEGESVEEAMSRIEKEALEVKDAQENLLMVAQKMKEAPATNRSTYPQNNLTPPKQPDFLDDHDTEDGEYKWYTTDIRKDDCVFATWCELSNEDTDNKFYYPCRVLNYDPQSCLFKLEAPEDQPQPPPLSRESIVTQRQENLFVSCCLHPDATDHYHNDEMNSTLEIPQSLLTNIESFIPVLQQILDKKLPSRAMKAFLTGKAKNMQLASLRYDAVHLKPQEKEFVEKYKMDITGKFGVDDCYEDAVQKYLKNKLNLSAFRNESSSDVNNMPDNVGYEEEVLANIGLRRQTILRNRRNNVFDDLEIDRLMTYVVMPEASKLLAEFRWSVAKEQMTKLKEGVMPVSINSSQRIHGKVYEKWVSKMLTLRQIMASGIRRREEANSYFQE
ncbi:hypothetical protein BCR33DRAFT_797661 [Rhizoclosmatium globosum]|uniref:Ubiquitin-like protease family profile domain-containing protein n=1 Tax=Rhizoclosmatium globosum TaxID=329046 RepID=A0A1Y2AGV5_9FUNG|nr:hypothetical protein BCR33DRAFT_797661 [Rhizoclosmatium globosum]|eukprot:ORY21684.1 hypothetical protein BCR33DRAFT_797661 [Rhizoclosmatium globosum]